MRAFVIKQLDPDDATSIYHIFERLNTGGSQLLGQEAGTSLRSSGICQTSTCCRNCAKPCSGLLEAGVLASFAPDFNVVDGEIVLFVAATPRDYRNRLDLDPQIGMSVCVTTPKPQDRALAGLDDVTRFDFDRSSRDAKNRAWSETQELALAR